MIGPSVSRPYRGSVGPFVGVNASGVPTARCPILPGVTSYLADDFTRNRGWWNLNSAVIANDALQYPATGGFTETFATPTTIPVAPTGASVFRIEGTFRWVWSWTNNTGCGLRIGGVSLFLGNYAPFAAPNVGVVVTTSSTLFPSVVSQLYVQQIAGINGEIREDQIAIDYGTVNTQYYYNGALIYTGAALASFTPSVKVSQSGNRATTWSDCIWFSWFGQGLPVNC